MTLSPTQQVQALDRTAPILPIRPGSPEKATHDYVRHGTTTLFAALDVATGAVRAGHYRRRRRVEFLDFMNRIVADHPDRDIHVVLDNLKEGVIKPDLYEPELNSVYAATLAHYGVVADLDLTALPPGFRST